MSLSSILALSRLAAAKRSLTVPRKAMLLPGRNLSVGSPTRPPTIFEDAIMLASLGFGSLFIPAWVTYYVSSYGNED